MHSPNDHATAPSSYAARCEAGIAVLAKACGADAEREVAGFRDVRAMLSRRHAAEVFELVMTLTGRGARDFAYLTQGAPAETLPASLRGLLEATLSSYLARGGERASALLLADLFASAFPDVTELTRYSAGAQAMVVGFAPRDRDLALKVYFNTRLSTATPHRQRVVSMLMLAGLDGALAGDAYDALYESADTRFQGLGIDIAAGSAPRGKVYVRCDRSQARSVATAISRLVTGDITESLVALVDDAARHLDEASLADEIELAIALRGESESARVSCKATLFFAAELVDLESERTAAAFIERHGCPAAPAQALFDALASNTARRSLHGLGFELGAGGAKINVYALPTR